MEKSGKHMWGWYTMVYKLEFLEKLDYYNETLT